MTSIKLPLWLRLVLIAGVAILASGAGLFAYRYYTHPVTLTVAVGSIDGEAAKAMSAIASELVSTNAPVRLKVIDSGTALEAANAFSAGKVDLAVVRGFFQLDHKKVPVLIPIESAAAIAEAERAFESFDVPKGTLRGSPPVPEDDLTTLRTSLYLVAHKKLGTDLVTRLTQAIMSVRSNLLREQPIFAQITAPSTDQDAYLPLHPGAAAVYNSTTQSFMDEYGNWIYLTPMVLGGAA